MHGSGSTPPVRNDGAVITMRVLFALCSVFSCGLLSCLPLFRIAILRGRWFDWAAAWVSLPVVIAAFAVVGELPDTDVRTDIAMAFVLLLGASSAGYYLVFDIRYYAQLTATGRTPYGPYVQQNQQPTHQPQYGYPNPYATTPVPQPQHQPQQPPHRIDQVRAELDELSDLLRKDQQDGQAR
ncbi:hypothetical protein [Streptomyces hypolithicus]